MLRLLPSKSKAKYSWRSRLDCRTLEIHRFAGPPSSKVFRNNHLDYREVAARTQIGHAPGHVRRLSLDVSTLPMVGLGAVCASGYGESRVDTASRYSLSM